MTDLLGDLFRSDGFMPHGHCYLWTRDILLLHVGSDLAIALAYYSIPAALVAFVRRREDVAFSWIFQLFALFIFACGTTHLFSVWTTWTPSYRIEGVVKAATALVSLGTAAALWPLLPRALAIPSSEHLRKANQALEEEVGQRRRAEERVRELNRTLERRVHERTRELESANRELQGFAYSVSHDLRAPLRAIAGYSEILTREHDEALAEEGRRLTGRIGANVGKMGQLIDDILAFSWLGKQEVDRQPLDMRALFENAFAELSQQDPDATIELEVGALRPASGDPAMVTQAVSNLLANALKYTRPKSPRRIRVSGRDADGEYVYSVEDNGVGFDPKFVDRIFRVFHRLHDAREFEGTGVGLAIVERVVERHGGRIWAEGRPGEGAVFHFTLPDPAPSTEGKEATEA